MASCSLSSDESDNDRAPDNFNIASTHENDGIHWPGECVMKCPMCKHLRKSFHCRNCVRDGDFVPSKSGDRSKAVRFSVKKAIYENVMKRHREVTDDAALLIQKLKDQESLRNDVAIKKQNIQMLREVLQKRQKEYTKAVEQNAAIQKGIEETRRKFPQYENNVKHLQEFVERRTMDNQTLALNRAQLQAQIQRRVKQRIEALVKYIFPISRVMNRSEHSPADASEVANHISELAEATRTAYVRGRWVMQDSQHEEHHIVVAPSLPGNGDYSAYVDWIASNKDGVPILGSGGAGGGKGRAGTEDIETLTSINHAYRISAALTYTTQMVDLLSFYLDVKLPFKVHYGDFCNKELTEAMFVQKVARLNGNILTLCYSQNVPPSLLSATHTLSNIQQLLAAEDLGRTGAVDIANSKIADVMQLNAEVVGDESDSEADDHSFPLEWEAVPHLAPHETVCPSALPQPSSLISTQQTVSMAGGLVNNAVASVTSIWRGFTGR